jgi:hypothetical protein
MALLASPVAALEHFHSTDGSGNVSGGGRAGFTREKTLEMQQFNKWRTQSPDGRAWEDSRRFQYRYPGDPRDNYEAPYIYKGSK